MNNKTSLGKFIEWQPKNTTHQERFIGIVGRHSINAKGWMDALTKYPIGSVELIAEMKRLSDELLVLMQESAETMSDMQDDLMGLRDIFITFQEEIGNMPENVSKPTIKRIDNDTAS